MAQTRAAIEHRRRLQVAEQPYLAAAAANREVAESLVRGIEVLMRKFEKLPAVPLDVLGRYERLVVAAHADNQLRVSGLPDKVLVEPER